MGRSGGTARPHERAVVVADVVVAAVEALLPLPGRPHIGALLSPGLRSRPRRPKQRSHPKLRGNGRRGGGVMRGHVDMAAAVAETKPRPLCRLDQDRTPGPSRTSLGLACGRSGETARSHERAVAAVVTDVADVVVAAVEALLPLPGRPHRVLTSSRPVADAVTTDTRDPRSRNSNRLINGRLVRSCASTGAIPQRNRSRSGGTTHPLTRGGRAEGGGPLRAGSPRGLHHLHDTEHLPHGRVPTTDTTIADTRGFRRRRR